jgi:hypothetical protein
MNWGTRHLIAPAAGCPIHSRSLRMCGCCHQHTVSRSHPNSHPSDSLTAWPRDCFRAYWKGEPGLGRMKYQEWPLEIEACPVEKFGVSSTMLRPLIRKERE